MKKLDLKEKVLILKLELFSLSLSEDVVKDETRFLQLVEKIKEYLVPLC